MSYCCPQCNFTANFESALMMHRQLHHDGNDGYPDFDSPIMMEKSNTVPCLSPPRSPFLHKGKGFSFAARTSSATRLFDRLKSRICKSKTLFSHPEESHDNTFHPIDIHVPSECTSKAMKVDSTFSRSSALTTCLEEARKESYGCHLCPFEADRITVLDRHLLNHHKIGLENLLKLVMEKTKHGLSEDNVQNLGIRQPYYKIQDEIIEEGEFIIETVAPKIKILKHASTNTENMIDNTYSYKMLAEQLGNSLKDQNKDGGADFMNKMATLNECMCKFVDSSNTLKNVLNKELDSKVNVGHLSGTEPIFNLGLGDTQRDWERAHSEKLERRKNNSQKCRSEKGKLSAESFNF